MMDVTTGTNAGITIEFGTAEAPVVPDSGTVSYSVFDNLNQVIPGLEAIVAATDLTAWAVNITIPNEYNTVGANRRFERRTVVVSYSVAGRTYSQTAVYRVVPRLWCSTQPEDIRAFIGVNRHELEDRDIDLFSAYLMVEEHVGQSALEEALASGTLREISANRLVMLQAVLAVLPSLKTRVAQSETNGPIGFTRAVIKDFSGVEQAARAEYAKALEAVTQTDPTQSTMTFVFVTQDEDPLTASA